MTASLRPTLFAACVAMAAVPAPASTPDPGQVAPDIVAGYLGEWLVAPVSGQPGCRIRLSKDMTIGGKVAESAADCATKLPKIADVTAWDIDGGIVLRDAERHAVVRFAEDETTLLQTPADVSPRYLLVKAKAGVDRAPSPRALFGTWAMRRPTGETLCEVTFGKTAPPGGSDPGLHLGEPCDPAVAKLKLSSWRIEGFGLMLYGDKETSLKFEPGPDGRYDKAEAGRPLWLVRVR